MPEWTPEELAFLHSVFDLAREGQAERLLEVLDAGIPVNLTNDSGDTLLILAAYHRHAAAVGTLLTRGADVDRVNDRGQTALGAAVFRRDEEIVRALLAAGADPDAGPRSARMLAAFFDLEDMAALLPAPAPGQPSPDPLGTAPTS
ncbi:MAG: ankyrin repeat domain-containing protein [Kineosporiaceae bacterium]